MAQNHFKTPPDPKRGYIRPKKSQKSLKVRAKPAKGRIEFCSGRGLYIECAAWTQHSDLKHEGCHQAALLVDTK